MSEHVYFRGLKLTIEPRLEHGNDGCPKCIGYDNTPFRCTTLPNCGISARGTGIRYVIDMNDDESVDLLALARLKGVV